MDGTRKLTFLVSICVVIVACVWILKLDENPVPSSNSMEKPPSRELPPSPVDPSQPSSDPAPSPGNNLPPPDPVAEVEVTLPQIISLEEMWAVDWISIEDTDTLVQLGPDTVARLRLLQKSDKGLVPFQPSTDEQRDIAIQIAESHEQSELMRDDYIEKAIARGEAWGPFESRVQARGVLNEKGKGKIIRYMRYFHAVVDLRPFNKSEEFRDQIAVRKSLAKVLDLSTYIVVMLDRP